MEELIIKIEHDISVNKRCLEESNLHPFTVELLELWIKFFAVNAQRTFSAFWISCGTAVTTKQNDSMAEITAFCGRKYGAQLIFYFFRILTLGKPQTTADANTVGIANNTAWFLIKIAQ